MTTPYLRIRNLTKRFGDFTALDDVSIDLYQGEFVCFLGPSGCGKTTLLRAISGLDIQTQGTVEQNGRDISALPPAKRDFGIVFQSYALFQNLTVARNIAYGLENRKQPKEAIRRRVQELLELIGLPDSGNKYPSQLSGGQQQRVALARALAPRPRLLLLDEPFSSLDVTLREGLAREVRAILLHEGAGGLLVSHNQFEAFAFADEIGVLREGRLLQWDSAYNLYHRPADRFVADFIGQGVLLAGQIAEGGHVATELGDMAGEPPAGCAPGDAVEVLVRPDDVIHDDASPLNAEVVERAFRGAEFLYTLRLPSGARLLCLAPSHHNHALGQRIGIRLDIDHRVMFRA